MIKTDTNIQSVIISLHRPIDFKDFSEKKTDNSKPLSTGKIQNKNQINKKMSEGELAKSVSEILNSHKGMFDISAREAHVFLSGNKNNINLSDNSQVTCALLVFEECKEKFGHDVKIEITFTEDGLSVSIRKDDGSGNPNSLVESILMSYEELDMPKDGVTSNKALEKIKDKIAKKIDEKAAKKEEFGKSVNSSFLNNINGVISNSFLARMIKGIIDEAGSARDEIRQNINKLEDAKRKDEKNFEKKLDEKIIEKKQLLKKLETLLQGIKTLKNANDSPSFYENVAVLDQSRSELGRINYDKKDSVGRAIEKARFGLVQLIDILNKEARGKSVNLK